MKRLTPQQIQNILFTVIVALAAVTIYLLAGRSAKEVEQEEPAPTPAITRPAAANSAFEPVPGAIFTFLMTGSDSFLAKADRDSATTLHMQCGGARTGRATLGFTLDESQCVSSFAITFPVPEPPPAKPKTKQEQRLVEEYEAFVAEQNVAVQTLLFAAVSACDLNGVILEPVALRWYSGALSARDSQKKYTDTYRGCAFEAYPLRVGANDMFVCAVILGK